MNKINVKAESVCFDFLTRMALTSLRIPCLSRTIGENKVNSYVKVNSKNTEQLDSVFTFPLCLFILLDNLDDENFYFQHKVRKIPDQNNGVK